MWTQQGKLEFFLEIRKLDCKAARAPLQVGSHLCGAEGQNLPFPAGHSSWDAAQDLGVWDFWAAEHLPGSCWASHPPTPPNPLWLFTLNSTDRILVPATCSSFMMGMKQSNLHLLSSLFSLLKHQSPTLSGRGGGAGGQCYLLYWSFGFCTFPGS